MARISSLILILATALLMGCSTSSEMKRDYRLPQGDQLRLELTAVPDATEQGLQILRDRLIEQLSNNGMLAADSDSSARTLRVDVVNYRLRHGATRALLGIMAGRDKVLSKVTITDAKTHQLLSEFEVESTNSSAWGTSHGLLQDHADEVVAVIKGPKPQDK